MKSIFLTAVAVLFFMIPFIYADDEESAREFNVSDTGAAEKNVTEAAGEDADENAKLPQNIISVGVLEKIDGDKYILRKVQTSIEFRLNNDTKFFMKTEGRPAELSEQKIVSVRGPRNKKTILANSIYVFDSREQYEQMTGTEEFQGSEKKQFSAPLVGTIKRADPMVITLEDGREIQVSWDEDTYWVVNKTVTKNELSPGDRIKLYFDRRISIRHKNYPVRIIIDKSKTDI
ncbi:MAG: hypothetical protein LLG37_08280 [Spirochaetia bacterium]|nr:hypothetical protein [Spirochaetia bacterium]